MQTQIGLFDLSATMPSSKCGKAGTDPFHQSGAKKPEQIEEFMEIMGALLALPAEELAKSLAELDVETVSGEVDGLCSGIGSDSKELEAARLLKTILGVNAGTGQQDDNSELALSTNELVGMFESFLKGNMGAEAQGSALDDESSQAALANWNTKWHQMYDQFRLSAQTSEGDKPVDGIVDAGELSLQNELPSVKGFPQAADAVEETGTDNDDIVNLDDQKGGSNHLKFMDTNRSKITGGLHKGGLGVNAHAQDTSASAYKSEIQGVPADATAAPEPPEDHLFPETSESGADGKGDDSGIDAFAGSDDSTGESLAKPSVSGLGRQSPTVRTELRGSQATASTAEIKEAVSEDKELRNDVVRQIVQRMSMHTQSGQSRMEIRLKPEFLGNVHLQVLTENHQVSVRMTADSTAVKEIVEQNLQHLKLELQHHGLEIQKFDVFVGGDSQEWRGGQNQAGFRQAFRQRQQRFGSGKSGTGDSGGISAVEADKKYSQTDATEIDYFV